MTTCNSRQLFMSDLLEELEPNERIIRSEYHTTKTIFNTKFDTINFTSFTDHDPSPSLSSTTFTQTTPKSISTTNDIPTLIGEVSRTFTFIQSEEKENDENENDENDNDENDKNENENDEVDYEVNNDIEFSEESNGDKHSKQIRVEEMEILNINRLQNNENGSKLFDEDYEFEPMFLCKNQLIQRIDDKLSQRSTINEMIFRGYLHQHPSISKFMIQRKQKRKKQRIIDLLEDLLLYSDKKRHKFGCWDLLNDKWKYIYFMEYFLLKYRMNDTFPNEIYLLMMKYCDTQSKKTYTFFHGISY